MKHLLLLVFLSLAACSSPSRTALDHYLEGLQSGTAEPLKALQADGNRLPILLGPPNQARDDLFRMIVSRARVKVLSVNAKEDRHLYSVQIETFDLESLLARTLVSLTVMERVATVPITSAMVQSVPFIEMHRQALLPDAPRKTVRAELPVVKKDGQWVVEPTQAFVVALFGFEAPKVEEKAKKAPLSSKSPQ